MPAVPRAEAALVAPMVAVEGRRCRNCKKNLPDQIFDYIALKKILIECGR